MMHIVATELQRFTLRETMQCCPRPSYQARAWRSCQVHGLRAGSLSKRGGGRAAQLRPRGLAGKGPLVETQPAAPAGTSTPVSSRGTGLLQLLLWPVTRFMQSLRRIFLSNQIPQDGDYFTMLLITAAFLVACWYV